MLTRVHSECLTGDVFGSAALRLRPAARRGAGARSSRRAAAWSSTCAATRAAGSGWSPSCRPTSCRTAAATPSTPTSTSACPADARHYGAATQILRDLGVGSVRLLTNNPDKVDQPRGLRRPVAERVPLTPRPNDHNLAYLLTKRDRMGHELPDLGTPDADRRRSAAP